MAWWELFTRKTRQSLDGVEYRVTANLYSIDGKRGIEIHELRNGQAYYVEQEWVRDTIFRNREPITIIGPFASVHEAETAAVATSWFNDGET
ncbi:hypothetical protein OVA03_14985 [Asticcacaulis sp. SL142]|uniref:hypothetical protein n=1 Tax=Asticcacaulis sp. SL142 TaxID=2995155 RepID=UPI00226D3CA7|nr:hypothetical protein [Asticcacaulis sp. SL142]WAC47984.1 hypothetical protein OVA03_14985 [Asticcacaulis sp. SL142]